MVVGDPPRCPRSWPPLPPLPPTLLCRLSLSSEHDSEDGANISWPPPPPLPPTLMWGLTLSSEHDSENEANEGRADASLWCPNEDAPVVSKGEKWPGNIFRDEDPP